VDTSGQVSKELDHPRRIRDLFSQHNLGSIYLSLTLEFLHLLLKLGAKPKEDGWRKYATAFLRTEDSRFLLGVFKLKTTESNLEGDHYIKTKLWIIEQLALFLQPIHNCGSHAWNGIAKERGSNPTHTLIWCGLSSKMAKDFQNSGLSSMSIRDFRWKIYITLTPRPSSRLITKHSLQVDSVLIIS